MKAELVNLARFKTDYFTKFRDLFVQEYGFFFAENRMEHFREVLITYMKKSPVETFDDYFDYLAGTMPGRIQFQNIMDDITIGETFFFRNEPQLEIFVQHIIPELVKQKRINGVNTIKIWSAGCSSGEEAYTLGILLLENLPVPQLWDIHILGTDINRNVLKSAQSGIYKGERPKRHLKKALMEKYFDTPSEGEFSVKEPLRRITRFRQHNLVKDGFNLPEMIDTDVVLCRNVTIYFNNETTKSVVENIYETLRPSGFFLIGHSETLWKVSKKFKTIDFPRAFIYQKPGVDEKLPPPVDESIPVMIPELNLANLALKDDQTEDKPHHTSAFSPALMPKPRRKEETQIPEDHSDLEALMGLDARYHEGVILFEKKDYEKALECFNEITEKDKDYLIAYFAKATIFSNQAQYEEAMEALDHLIQADNLFLEAYFLKSILHIKLHERDSAINTLKKVIYIEPDSGLAYFHLAHLYQEDQEWGQSRLAWSNLRRICGKFSKDDYVPMTENLTYETLDTLAEKSLNEMN